MSSGSYFVLAIYEPVQRYRNESVIALKISSSGKAEQYETPLVMEHLRGLPKSLVSVRNVRSMASWSVARVAQLLYAHDTERSKY